MFLAENFVSGQKTLFLARKHCFWSENFVSGQKTLFLTKQLCFWQKTLFLAKQLCFWQKTLFLAENFVSDRKTLFLVGKLCFWSENFVSGQKTLFLVRKLCLGTRNKVLASENFVPENLPIRLAISVRPTWYPGKGLVINYGEGGLQNEKTQVRNFLRPPPPSRQGKTFRAPLLRVETFHAPPPLTIWLKLTGTV